MTARGAVRAATWPAAHGRSNPAPSAIKTHFCLLDISVFFCCSLFIIMIICFEGVESEAVYQSVRNFGDSLCQGYYFAKPQHAGELLKRIENEERNKRDSM